MNLSPDLIDRFRKDLDALAASGSRVGLAVSGGPDSLALLLLTTDVRPGLIEAASVDHALRPESRVECEMVAELCGRLGVPHSILTIDWDEAPVSQVQAQASLNRYRLLESWAQHRGL